MSKKIRILLIIISVLLVGGLVYWQLIKKNVVKMAIKNAVSNATDDDYYVKYDSSYIDEVSGNAGFYNIVLQNDSARIKMLNQDTSVDRTIVDITVEAVEITGLNVPGFLSKNTVSASKLKIVGPVVKIIATGKAERKLTKEDSLALYKRLTGKFNNIQASEIEIVNGKILFANRLQEPHTRLEGVNMVLKNLQVDKEHNYENIISYLVKNLEVAVESFTQKNEKENVDFTAMDIRYSTSGKFISIEKVEQQDISGGVPAMQISKIKIAGIDTRKFIYEQKIEAESFTTRGGSVSLRKVKSGNNQKEQLDIENDFFTRAQIKNIDIGETDLRISSGRNQEVIIKKVRFKANSVGTVSTGTNLQRLLAGSNFKVSAEGTTLRTKDDLYDIKISPFTLTGETKTLSIKKLEIKPTMTWQQYGKTLKVQKDLYDLSFKDLTLSGFDIDALLINNSIIAQEITLTPEMRIYNDRTVPFDKSSKIGLYPHQQLVSLNIPVYISKVTVKNGSVMYRERGALSKKTGDVSFTNIWATIGNVTNMKEKIARNSTMTFSAKAKFLGQADLSTTWMLPLTKGNGTFTARGDMGGMNASRLSAITKPLGMAEISSGALNGLSFSMTGNDTHTNGKATIKYDGLKVKMLKSDGDSTTALEKKGLMTTLANLLIKNSNPRNGNLREGEIDFERDITKSFFNLLWKSIFQAVQRIAKGKDDG